MVSLALRHGTKVHLLVEQLQKTHKDSSMSSFSRVLARQLKKYIEDGTVATANTCLECGTEGVVYKDGCASCVNCGWSKCM